MDERTYDRRTTAMQQRIDQLAVDAYKHDAELADTYNALVQRYAEQPEQVTSTDVPYIIEAHEHPAVDTVTAEHVLERYAGDTTLDPADQDIESVSWDAIRDSVDHLNRIDFPAAERREELAQYYVTLGLKHADSYVQ